MKILKEKEAEDFLEKEGFPIVKRAIVYNKKELKKQASKIGFPLVLKNPNILHKTEKGAVIKNVTEKKLLPTYKKIKSKTVEIQKQVDGLEILIGLKKDPTFGHVVVFGLGGVFSEILEDVAFRICPITKKEISFMFKELKAFPVLKGARGIKVDLTSIKKIILKISNLPKKHPQIKELDINPLIISGKDLSIVDARIIFEN